MIGGQDSLKTCFLLNILDCNLMKWIEFQLKGNWVQKHAYNLQVKQNYLLNGAIDWMV